MNSCYNFGCNSCMPMYSNPFGCGGCNSYPIYGGCGGFGNGSTWFAIVLVVFLLLIICGCTKIC
jgi:hypothetical protein